MELPREAAACPGEGELGACVKCAQMIFHVVVERQFQGAISVSLSIVVPRPETGPWSSYLSCIG